MFFVYYKDYFNSKYAQYPLKYWHEAFDILDHGNFENFKFDTKAPGEFMVGSFDVDKLIPDVGPIEVSGGNEMFMQ